jgi:hypothetical protein
VVSKPTTRDMSDKHEITLAELLGGRVTRGSGNQFRDQMDGRNSRHQAHALAWDGKSTQASSTIVSRQMWTKAIEQAAGEKPMLALRFYGPGYELTPQVDLAVLDLHDFVEILEDARAYRKVQLCLEQGHVTSGKKGDPNSCVECGLPAGWEA